MKLNENKIPKLTLICYSLSPRIKLLEHYTKPRGQKRKKNAPMKHKTFFGKSITNTC